MKILACVAMILAFSPLAPAYESPAIQVTSDTYPTWRNSVNLSVFAHPSGQLVEFTVLLEKPPRDICWNLHLDAYHGTNIIARSSLGYEILGPSLTSYLTNTNFAEKTVQRFSFSLSSDLITNSVVVFTKDRERESANPFMRESSVPSVVRLVDMFSSAEKDQDSVPNLPGTCVMVTNAINQEDWATLRKLSKPGMLANNYGQSFEAETNKANPTPEMHLDYIVGKFLMVQSKLGADGKTNKVYSFQLQNKNGTVNPHWLQITVREEHGRSELVDFWNFGW